LSTTASGTADLLFKEFSSANVTFSGGSWSVPDEWKSENAPIQTRQNVSNIVNKSGTSTATTDTPGGITVGATSLAPSGSDDFSEGSLASGRIRKTNLPEDDIGVVLANLSAETKDLNYSIEFELDF
jgi:hypothetical protein